MRLGSASVGWAEAPTVPLKEEPAGEGLPRGATDFIHKQCETSKQSRTSRWQQCDGGVIHKEHSGRARKERAVATG